MENNFTFPALDRFRLSRANSIASPAAIMQMSGASKSGGLFSFRLERAPVCGISCAHSAGAAREEQLNLQFAQIIDTNQQASGLENEGGQFRTHSKKSEAAQIWPPRSRSRAVWL